MMTPRRLSNKRFEPFYFWTPDLTIISRAHYQTMLRGQWNYMNISALRQTWTADLAIAAVSLTVSWSYRKIRTLYQLSYEGLYEWIHYFIYKDFGFIFLNLLTCLGLFEPIKLNHRLMFLNPGISNLNCCPFLDTEP